MKVDFGIVHTACIFHGISSLAHVAIRICCKNRFGLLLRHAYSYWCMIMSTNETNHLFLDLDYITCVCGVLNLTSDAIYFGLFVCL